MVFSNNLLLGAVSAGASGYLLEQSLLGDGTSSYLNRTPSVAGNRKTWTFSCWFKGTPVSSSFISVEANDANGPQTDIAFQGGANTNKFEVYGYSSSYDFRLLTSSLYRDSSAWYHIVVAMDTTQATASNRTKIYINGTQVTSFGTADYPTLNYDTGINTLKEHFVMKGPGAGGWVNGAVALPILVDGAALNATSFGETDNDGFWNPVEFTGAPTTDLISPATGTAEDTGTTSFGYAGRVIAYAFDGILIATDATSANTANHTTPAALGKDWGTATLVTKAVVYGQSGSAGIHGAGTFDLTLQGWNGSAWVDLSTLAGLSGSAGQIEVLNYSGGVSYSKHRVLIDEITNSEQTAVAELQFFTESTSEGFGTNGFQLDFADTSDFGADVSYTGDTSVTFTDSSVNSGSATAYTFSSQAIGTASSDRVVAVGVTAGNSAAGVSTLTVGGVSAVKAIDVTNNTEAELWYASVPSGTTADIVVTFSSGKGRCGIGVWALTGVTGVGATNTSTSSTATLTVSGITKDIVLAVYGGKDHTSVSFSGVTENYDEDISGAGSQYQAGGSKKLTATGSNTITVTPNTGATEVAAVSGVFPATGNNGYFANNFTADDQLEDSPTDSSDDEIGNFITLNPNDRNNTSLVLTEGNTYLTASGDGGIKGTIFVNSGEHHFEYVPVSTTTNNMSVGITLATSSLTNETPTTGDYAFNIRNGTEGGRAYDIFANGVTIATGSLPAAPNGKNIGVVFDADAGTLKFYNSDLAASGDLIYTISSIPAGSYTVLARSSNNTHIFDFNFGQRPFVDTNLNNANAIATQNLPAPTIADGSQQFTPVLYTGTGSELAIASLDFTPDFVWIKNRDATDNHMLYDSVRGATKDLHSNTTDAETTTAQTLKSFDSAGFTLGTDVQVNTNTEDYVAWCWKAGGAASSNTDGSITTSVSANTTSGFSIISYTGNATAGATLGHGLSSAPKFILAKNRDDGVNAWAGYHVALGGTHRIFLNTNAAAQDDDGNWYDTNPTASVITLGNGGISNSNTDDFIMYAWAEVEGFSKFGSYTGNANVDGPFIYTGFRPAFILEKRTDSAGAWYITDMTRDTYNPVNKYLMPDASNAEASGSTSSGVYLDALSNGYKIRGAGAGQEYNRSGGTYIFAAFAEHPFQGADGVTQARAR